MLRPYSGSLGEFVYNDDEFKVELICIEKDVFKDALRYIGNGNAVSLPKGCISTRFMFRGCKLPEGFSLYESFNTSNVVDMACMFYDCKLPKGFTLGPNFNTSNVIDMIGMFYGCDLPENFSLGPNFDTSSVTSMRYMFCKCDLPAEFSLGSKFNTSSVKSMKSMFEYCHAHTTLNLGSKFNTENVTNMACMFMDAKLDDGIELGDNFDTSNVQTMQRMFSNTKVGDKFSLGSKFDTSNVKKFSSMFTNVIFPTDFKFPSRFIISDTANISGMFDWTKFPVNFCLDIECNITSKYCAVFEGCTFPKGFSFGERFNVEKGILLEDLFDGCYVDGEDLDKYLSKYAIDAVNYFKKSNDGCHITINSNSISKDDLVRHLSHVLNVSESSVCDAIDSFTREYADEGSNTESEEMKLF